MQITKRVFLIHGWEGNAQNHWFPWITRELAEYGFAVFAPEMPNTMHPKLDEWLAELKRIIVNPDEDTYIIGHSLGCITSARFIIGLPKGVRIGGAVFVGGFSGDISQPEIKDFYMEPFDSKSAKEHSKGFSSIASTDDESVPFEKSREFSEQLDANFIAETGKGHFCAEDGVTQLPSALKELLRLADVKP